MVNQTYDKRFKIGGVQNWIFTFATIFLKLFYIVSQKSPILYMKQISLHFCTPPIPNFLVCWFQYSFCFGCTLKTELDRTLDGFVPQNSLIVLYPGPKQLWRKYKHNSGKKEEERNTNFTNSLGIFLFILWQIFCACICLLLFMLGGAPGNWVKVSKTFFFCDQFGFYFELLGFINFYSVRSIKEARSKCW